MQALLRVVQKQANIQQVRLLPETVIGRSVDCQLKIASTQVSRRHCRIVVNDAGVFVEDLCSANGTFLDGQRLLPNQPMLASSGAELVIGPATFTVECRSRSMSPNLGVIPPAVALETVPATSDETASPQRPEIQNAFSGRSESAEPAVSVESVFASFVTDVVEPAESAPVAEPPQRMRSLFGLFRRGEPVAKPAAPVPLLPAESSPISEGAEIETPIDDVVALSEPAAEDSELPFSFGGRDANIAPAETDDNPFREFSQY